MKILLALAFLTAGFDASAITKNYCGTVIAVIYDLTSAVDNHLQVDIRDVRSVNRVTLSDTLASSVTTVELLTRGLGDSNLTVCLSGLVYAHGASIIELLAR